jgi:hypothetical protein
VRCDVRIIYTSMTSQIFFIIYICHNSELCTYTWELDFYIVFFYLFVVILDVIYIYCQYIMYVLIIY